MAHGCYNREIKKGYYVMVREHFGKTEEHSSNRPYSFKNEFIEHRMSTDCRYDFKATDPDCTGCKWRED